MLMSNDLVYVLHSEAAVAGRLSDGLQEAGYEVVCMTTVAEAQEIISGRQFALPDAILTPVGDVESGDSILITLFQSNPLMEQIPLVVVATSEKEERRRALRMGLLSVVFPPYDGEEVALTTRLAIDKHRSDQLLFGSLSQLSVPDLLQTAEVGRRSGTINFQHNGDKAAVWLRDGFIVDAEVENGANGKDAVYEIALWTTGTFEANFGAVVVTERFRFLPSEVLLEAMRRLDEERAGEREKATETEAPIAALDLSLALLNVVAGYALGHLEPILVGRRIEDVRSELENQHPTLAHFDVAPEGPVTIPGATPSDVEVEDLAAAIGAWVVEFFARMDEAMAWRFASQRVAKLLAPWRREMQSLGFLEPLGIAAAESVKEDEDGNGSARSQGRPVPTGCLVLDGDGFVETFSSFGPRVGHVDPEAVVSRPISAILPHSLAALVERLASELVPATEAGRKWATGDEVFRAGHREFVVRVSLVQPASGQGVIAVVNRLRDGRCSLSPEIARDPLTGSLRDAADERLLVANSDFLQAFDSLFARSLSHRHHELLQRLGKKWGLRHAMRLEQLVQRDYRMTLREMESQMALELLSSSIGVLGLGSFDANLSFRQSGLVVISHQASPFPEIFATNPGGACSILSGFHAAIVSYLAGRHLAAREIRCSREPGDPCLFVVATEERLTKLLIATPGSPDHELLEEILGNREEGGVS
jgi:CheY-like chemotaxis protein